VSLNILRWRYRTSLNAMPGRFYELATYNGEVSRGILHTPEKVEQMRQLQADFNAWRDARREAEWR
jgi:hypothetical protein